MRQQATTGVPFPACETCTQHREVKKRTFPQSVWRDVYKSADQCSKTWPNIQQIQILSETPFYRDTNLSKDIFCNITLPLPFAYISFLHLICCVKYVLHVTPTIMPHLFTLPPCISKVEGAYFTSLVISLCILQVVGPLLAPKGGWNIL